MKLVVRLSFAILLLFAASGFAACSENDPIGDGIANGNVGNDGADGGADNGDNYGNDMERNVKITVNGTSFSATLADNATAQAFAAMFPVTLEMDDLNRNEKYHYLDNGLPAAAHAVDVIHAGDLMLYGSSCVVLFYETFASGYSYTRIGKVDNPDSLAAALGCGNVSVTFDMR